MRKKKASLAVDLVSEFDGQTLNGSDQGDTLANAHNNTILNGRGGDDRLITDLYRIDGVTDIFAEHNGGDGDDYSDMLVTTDRYFGGITRGGAGSDFLSTAIFGYFTADFNMIEVYTLGGIGDDGIQMFASNFAKSSIIWQEAYGENGDDTIDITALSYNFGGYSDVYSYA